MREGSGEQNLNGGLGLILLERWGSADFHSIAPPCLSRFCERANIQPRSSSLRPPEKEAGGDIQPGGW
jgi:hypothetical protein